MVRPFQLFIAVDWSGARGPRLPGLQVAACRPGRNAPRLIRPPDGARTWSRLAVAGFLLEQTRLHGPVLAGLDMGLALPYLDRGCYFPACPECPPTAADLWAAIERHADDAPDLYAGAIGGEGKPFADYFNLPGRRGPRFEIARHRQTERVCRNWTRPSSVFNGVGAGSVGMGSLAGMRLLHRLHREPGPPRIAIWPFQEIDCADLVVVEIFPRLYAKRAGLNPQAWRDPAFMPAITRHYQSNAPRPAPRTEDETDALFSAAALRHLARQPETWQPNAMAPEAARFEGWIFGVK